MVKISLVAFLFATSATGFSAENKVVKIDTRPGVSVPVYYMKRDNPSATVVLLMGGGGNINLKQGEPRSRNFVVRSRDYFTAHGFNVALVDRPSDRELDFNFRISPEHVQDLRQVVSYVKKDSGLPVWIVGTSRGTISAAAAAIGFGNEELSGLILTSSVTRADRTGALPTQKLDAIRVPVLVMHHEKDACPICKPGEVPLILAGLKNAPVKKQIMVNGGANPEGDPCEALHWHGYIGMEKEAVNIIADWIINPKP